MNESSESLHQQPMMSDQSLSIQDTLSNEQSLSNLIQISSQSEDNSIQAMNISERTCLNDSDDRINTDTTITSNNQSNQQLNDEVSSPIDHDNNDNHKQDNNVINTNNSQNLTIAICKSRR